MQKNKKKLKRRGIRISGIETAEIIKIPDFFFIILDYFWHVKEFIQEKTKRKFKYEYEHLALFSEFFKKQENKET